MGCPPRLRFFWQRLSRPCVQGVALGAVGSVLADGAQTGGHGCSCCGWVRWSSGRTTWRLALSVHATFKISDGGLEAVAQGDLGLPAQDGLGQADVGPALTGIVLGQGLMHQGRTGPGKVADGLGEFDHGEFTRVSEVDGAGKVVGAVHQAHEARDEVVHVAEGPGLGTVAVKGNGLVAQGLDDEVGDDPAVVGVHAGAVGVEDAGDLDTQLVLTAVVEEQGLGAAFAFVVAGAGADGVDVAPVVHRLGMAGSP